MSIEKSLIKHLKSKDEFIVKSNRIASLYISYAIECLACRSSKPGSIPGWDRLE